MAKSTNQVTKSGAVLLDPDNVGSSIRWRSTICRRSGKLRTESQVMLTDCDRQITWSAWGGDDVILLIDRIDKAIEALTEARNSIGVTAREWLKRNKKRGSRK